MNIYDRLTDAEKEKVNKYSSRVNTEKKSEPLYFKRQLVSNYTLEVFKEGHPSEFKKIQKEIESEKKVTYERIETRWQERRAKEEEQTE